MWGEAKRYDVVSIGGGREAHGAELWIRMEGDGSAAAGTMVVGLLDDVASRNRSKIC
jgi:hypothetical protein